MAGAGPAFYQLHLLFDKHHEGQASIAGALGERVQTLGGVAIAMAPDVAETTRIARVPKGCEAVAIQLFRLLQAHELIIDEAREAARAASAEGDDGTGDLLVSDVIRVNELQAWFIAGQLEGSGITTSGK